MGGRCTVVGGIGDRIGSIPADNPSWEAKDVHGRSSIDQSAAAGSRGIGCDLGRATHAHAVLLLGLVAPRRLVLAKASSKALEDGEELILGKR